MAKVSPEALVPFEDQGGSQDAFRPGSPQPSNGSAAVPLAKAPNAGAPSPSSAADAMDKGATNAGVHFGGVDDDGGPAPPPEALVPAIAVDAERLICGANTATVLLVLSAVLTGLSAFLPWWIWVGRESDDFWGLQPGAKSTFSPVEACQGPRDPEGSTCLTTGSISTFLLIAAACSIGASVVFELVACKLQWIFLMLTASLVAATGTAFGGLAVYLGIQLQITGLRGEGLYLGFTGICFSAAAAALGIWTANKATPPAGSLGTTVEIKESRITRSRAVHQAAELLRESLDRRQKERSRKYRMQQGTEGEIVRGMTPVQSHRSRVPRYQPQTNKKNGRLEEGRHLKKANKKPNRPHLQYVIDNSMGGDGRVISVKILEAAYQEIDTDYSGSLTLEELATALRDCGLNPSQEAMDRIVREIDKDCDGTIDINEFVGFFQMAQELYDFQQRRDGRAKILHAAVQFIFAANVASVAILITLQSRADDTDSVGYKRIQGIVNMLMISFVVLFVLVVILPLFRLTLGPSVLAWLDVGVYHVKTRYRAWKARRQEAARKKKELKALAKAAADPEAGNSSSDGNNLGEQDLNRTSNSTFTTSGAGSPSRWAAVSDKAAPSPAAREGKLKRSMTQQSRMSKQSRASSVASSWRKVWRKTVDDVNTHPGYDPMSYKRADRRHWSLCYEDGYIEIYCQRSKWSTKDRLVIELFAERVRDEWFVAEEDDDGERPRSKVYNLKLEIPRAAGVQVLESDIPQNEERENILWLCLGECRDLTPTISLWVWPHPMVDQNWLTPANRDLPGCCILYDLMLPDTPDQEVYVKAHLKWDHWKQFRQFNGPMQVPDPGRHLSIGDVAPDQKEVRGGMAANRGEWRLGLADK